MMPFRNPGNRDLGTPPPNWRGLRFFNAYRLTVAALLLGAHILTLQRGQIGLPHADNFTIAVAIYGLAAMVMLTLDELRLGGYAQRLQTGLAIDIVMLGLLGHVDGAPSGNIHILMVIHMAYASILLGGREALAFAALGSVHLLLLAFWSSRQGGSADLLFTHAGLHGMALFAVAVLAQTLARRMEAAQALAEQRSIDLANETQLNRLILERSQEGCWWWTATTRPTTPTRPLCDCCATAGKPISAVATSPQSTRLWPRPCRPGANSRKTAWRWHASTGRNGCMSASPR